MQVYWDSTVGGMPRLVSGKRMTRSNHTPRTPRVWLVELTLWSETAKERFILRPNKKLTMHDLQAVVDEQIALFEKESGEVIRSNWIATAR